MRNRLEGAAMTRAALLLPLLAAACVHPAPRPGMPATDDLELALRPIDLCAGDESGSCDSFGMPERIRLVSSRCAPLPSPKGKRVVACRVTYREVQYGGAVRRAYAAQCIQLTAEPLPGREDLTYWGREWDWDATWADVEEPCRRAGI